MSLLTPDTYNRIQQLYQQLLTAARGTATVNCSISIRKLLGDLNKNCLIDIINTCVRDVNTLVLLDIAVDKILSLLEGTNTPALSAAYTTLRQDCIVQTSVNQSISIQDINLGICRPTFPVRFQFTNSGNATTNCINSALLRLTQVTSDSAETVDNQDTNFLILGLIVLALGIAAIGIVTYTTERRVFILRRT